MEANHDRWAVPPDIGQGAEECTASCHFGTCIWVVFFAWCAGTCRERQLSNLQEQCDLEKRVSAHRLAASQGEVRDVMLLESAVRAWWTSVKDLQQRAMMDLYWKQAETSTQCAVAALQKVQGKALTSVALARWKEEVLIFRK
eukprot:CAMPEP_0180661028 /NCGR_PEP_ID=MMETSP1037_2-20121125/58595_1 /TAXON_ID=632150 /ORGANISM="Azadinium spinosum, Strain 3D9" /LENGTH=142 /DNA_ID=CAMNT_0022688507 /DNA_START=40 /DNA_END=465 /DNA_ORIENTATION=+